MAQTEDLDSIRFLEAGMAAGSHGVWGHGLVLTPGEAELARLRERFRGHHIFHDVRWDREVRYLAYRTASGVQPDTVITDDLAQLREQLEQAAPPDLGTGLFLLFAQEPGIGDPDACQWSSGPNPAVPAVDTGLAGSTRRWRSTGTAQRRAACGTLSSPAGLHRAELGGIAIKAALERAALFTANPDDVIIGQVLQADAGQNPARQAAVAAGSPMTVPSITLNKVCLSGLDAIAFAAQLLRVGELDIVVAGGMESMTRAPHLLPEGRTGGKYGSMELLDAMARDGLSDAFDHTPMGELTERHNTRLGVSRAEQDEFAARSHQRAAAAIKDGTLARWSRSGPAAARRPGVVRRR